MPNFLNKLLVRTPSYNVFKYPTVHNKCDMQIGRNIPVKWLELHAGEECDINFSQLTRFMPLQNPIMHRVDMEFIPFFVPFRLLEEFGWKARDYFNPATPDSDRPAMPMIHIKDLYYRCDSIIGSIWDYLRYPTYSYLLRQLEEDFVGFSITEYNSDSPSSAGSNPYKYAGLYDLSVGEDKPNGFHIAYSHSSIEFYTNVFSFEVYVIRELLKATGKWDDTQAALWSIDGVHDNSGSFDWDSIYLATGKRQDDWVRSYISHLHYLLVLAYLPDNTSKNVSLLPWLCYSRLIYDWFINTNLVDVSSVPSLFSELLNQIMNEGLSMNGALDEVFSGNSDLQYFFPYPSGDSYVARIAFTLWSRDYFTGAFPNSQSGDAVPIPQNGTIPQLTEARKLQKYRTTTLFGGKRFIDQIFAHRGVKSSDARLDRCEVIGDKKVYHLQISDVLQTSQSTIDSAQGAFSGHGISYSGDHLCHYRAEEPGLVMIIGRCKPYNSYMDVVPRLIFKSDFYDFENPEFDNVGMQPIMAAELCGARSENDVVFGWTRRYEEYRTDTDEYHGNFLTSLVNWHMGRSFGNGRPLLNSTFSVIKSDGSDDLNRVFANPGYRWNVLCDLAFDIEVSRPLSKFVEFDF